MVSIFSVLFSYRREKRKFLLLILDSLLITFSIVTSFWFLNPNNFIDNFEKYKITEFIFLNLLVSLPIYFYTGQYKGINRFIGSTLLYRFTLRNFAIIIFLFCLTNIFKIYNVTIKLWLLIFIFETLLTTSIRFLFRDILSKAKLLNFKKNIINILIYGAGSAGTTLATYIQKDNRYKLCGFIDDNPELWNREIKGIEIYSSKKLEKLIRIKNIKKFFFAIPSLDLENSRNILNELQKYNVEVLKVPSFKEITEGRERINNLKPISVEDLLKRNKAKPSNKLLGQGIKNKNIMITGSGGSIGSELTRQIIKFYPNKIILLEQNEPSLYLIYEEIKNIAKKFDIEIIPVLGNACDKKLLFKVFEKNNINIIFHAAAHKHVPMVEINPIEGLKNNILSTLSLAQMACEFNIDKFTLISSDKAVRPTSIMGASKRVSELIIERFSNEMYRKNNYSENSKTIFSMVRFGNVLNSSGSVIPLFQSQIAKGGPITITHPEITRYFMTIPEAIELVLQSSSISKGGEIFLLDMGESIKISELAKQLISLSGYKFKDENNEGDIEIIYTGLRPGEKLYEELLIDSNSESTEHPLIFTSKETKNNDQNLLQNINLLLNSLNNQNKKEAFNFLAKIVKEWRNKK